ncbi:MlaD family protein [Nocardia sp. NPDC055029]
MQRRLTTSGGSVGASILSAVRRIVSNEFSLGMTVVFLVTIIVAATVGLYLAPPGRKQLSFETTDAAAVRSGQDVRVAGVSVGKISAVTLGRDRVRVTADIGADTFIGDDSRIEVRMLTAVGGYFVTIISIGEKPLSDQLIPAERVTMPYSIADILQEVPRITDNIDGSTVNADIEQLAQGLQHNAGSVGSLIAGLDSIARVMATQRLQIRTTLDLATEYAEAFNGSREFLFDFIRKIEVVLGTYNTYRDGFNRAYQLMGDVVMRLEPIEQYFLANKEELRAVVQQLRDGIANFLQAMDPAIGQLNQLRGQLGGILTPEGIAEVGGGQLLASQFCVPIPGREC